MLPNSVSTCVRCLAVIIAASLCASLSVYAAIQFGDEHLVFRNAVSQPHQVFAVDMDGDNDKDILALGTANQADTITWFENTNGAGAFGPPLIIADTFETRAIYPADLDGDNDLDIVATSIGFDKKVFWFENLDGKGHFGPRQIISSGENVLTVFAADLDRDGDMDVLWGSANSDSVSWAENTDGQGTFGPRQAIVSGAAVADVAQVSAGDMDGDNDNDIVVTISSYFAPTNDHRVVWYENTTTTPGNATFSTTENVIGHLIGISPFDLADIDGDNDVDVVAGSQFASGFGISANISWFENTNGSGAFSAARQVAANLATVTSLRAANVDGDTDLDVIYTDQDSGTLAWAENTDGKGSFSTPHIISTGLYYVQCCDAGDFDDDNHADVAYGNYQSEVGWFKNMNPGFGSATPITIGFQFLNDLTLGDVDGDGRADIVGCSFYDGEIFESRGTAGGFAPLEILASGATEVGSVTVADLDGANGSDLIAARTGDGSMPDPDDFIWYANNGANMFPASATIDGTGDAPWSSAAADLDKDNDLDLIVAWSGSDRVKWVKNNGGGSFAAPVQLGVVDGAQSVAAGDIDGDMDMDVVAAGWIDGNVYVYKNTDGMGTFSSGTMVADLSNGADRLQLADMDKDGDLDIFFIKTSDPTRTAQWLENTNSGTFVNSHPIFAGGLTAMNDAIAVDLDNDGDPDVVTVQADSNGSVRIYENDGSGSFSLSQTLTKKSYRCNYVVARDVDGDGDQDIIVGSSAQVCVYWYENALLAPPADPLTEWAAGYGITGNDAAPDTDGDADGAPLLAEFAFNLNPKSADADQMVSGGTNGLPRVWYEQRGASPDWWLNAEFVRRISPANNGLTYSLEGVSNVAGALNELTDASPQVTPIDGSWERVLLDANVGTVPMHFGTLRVEYVAP